MRALRGDAAIHGQCAKEGKQDQDQGGDWRKSAGGEKSDAGLITECRKVVDTSQAHDLPPRMLLVVNSVRGLTCFLQSSEQPELKPSPCVLGKNHRVG